MITDQVFALRRNGQPVWKAIVNGVVIAADWHDRGSALAGLETEQRRLAASTQRSDGRDLISEGIMPVELWDLSEEEKP